MARKRGQYGNGSIDKAGDDTWRLRYRIGGKRYAKHVHGSKADAVKELRRLIHAGDEGKHVAPDKMTLAQWVPQWIALKKLGKKGVAGQTSDRYSDLLTHHVLPVLGEKRLQKIESSDINGLYVDVQLAPRTTKLLHVVLKACFASAVKNKKIPANPVDDAEKPAGDDNEVGVVLDEQPLASLVAGFKGHSLYGIVATGAYTGMRKGEILALQWSDIDFAAKTISVSRNVEETAATGRGVKKPKTWRGTRTFEIDSALCDLLRRERDRQLRLVAGLPDGADVDLSLIRLPAEALCFPAMGANLTALRSPHSVYSMFAKRARALGFDMRFHDLRGTHSTILLDKNAPVHVVAKRIGDDPATLLRRYAKRTKKADTDAANIIGTLTAGVL
jgi:integrase